MTTFIIFKSLIAGALGGKLAADNAAPAPVIVVPPAAETKDGQGEV